MALFNPRPVLRNPNFATPGGFTIRRQTRITDAEGVPVTTYDVIHAEGVVVPSGQLGMIRTAEAEQQGDGITIYCEEPISTGHGDTNTVADIIIWHGQQYQVTGQDDYGDFGFNVAQANLVEPGGRDA